MLRHESSPTDLMQIYSKSYIHLTGAIGDVFVIISLDSKAIILLMWVNNIEYLNNPSDFLLKLLMRQHLLSCIITACFFNNNTDFLKKYRLFKKSLTEEEILVIQ